MKRFLRAAACMASLLAATAPAGADPLATGGFAANDIDFLNLMGNVEAPDGFSDVYNGTPLLPPERLEDMTIGDVLAYQTTIRAMGTASSAVGRYQFIHVTLSQLVTELGISHDLVFDGEVQTFLARALMSKCGFYDLDRNSLVLADCLAGVWAALPLVTGPDRGLSAHVGDGLNHALVAPESILGVLDRRFIW